MRKGDFASTKGGMEFESLIDKAIDDLFQPHSAKKAPEPELAEPAPEIAFASTAASKEPSLEISWGAATAPEEPAPPPPPPPEFKSVPPAAAEEETYEGMDEEDRGPSLAVLRPLHERLLSLDWEFNNKNISEFESALGDLESLSQANVHARTTLRMASITCKYLRASKSLATPLALKFLRAVVRALDLFLAEDAPGRPSKDALVNDLMGLYNDMKEDANRLRAAALRRRAEDAGSAAPPSPAAPAAPSPRPTPAAPIQQPVPAPHVVGAVTVTETGPEEEIEELEPVEQPMEEPEIVAAPGPGPIPVPSPESASEMERLRHSVEALLQAVLRIESKLDSLAHAPGKGKA
jgi:hypothetical protein